MSDQGMIAAHLFEQGEDRNGNPDLADTLYPGKVDATLAAVAPLFEANKDKLAGGQLLIMTPNNPDEPTKLQYESARWNGVTKAGKWDKKNTIGPAVGTVAKIQKMAEDSTGLTLTKPMFRYTPAVDDAEDKKWQDEGLSKGTFAVQYDAKAKTRQVWFEGVPQFAADIVAAST